MKKLLLLLLVAFGVQQLNAQLSLTINHTNTLCYSMCNGTVTPVPSGGTPPYTYAWNPMISNTSAVCPGTYTCTVTDAATNTATATVTVGQPIALTVSVTSVNAICGNPNGSATATPSGGTPPYTASWNSVPVQNTLTATGLLPGSYTVTITDQNACTATNTVIITNQAGPTASISSVTSVSCNSMCDGSATASVSGGTAPYTYAWSPAGGNTPTISNACAGNYSMTVTDANGCTATASVSITQPAPVNITISPSYPTICSGNSLVMYGSGGMTYVWYPSSQTTQSITVSPTVTTTYTLAGTDPMGCTGTAVSTVYVVPNPTVNISSFQNVTCFGGSDGTATAAGSGGTPPYAYVWSPPAINIATATGLSSGTYSVTTTDAYGCTATTTAIITEPPLLVAIPGTIIPAGCNFSNGSADVSASGGTGTYAYSWTPAMVSSMNYVNAPAGTQTITVTDSNGCTATTTMTVTDSCDYVWPGDANDDAVADNNDILDIGIANNATGTTRANATLTWIGQPSAAWGQTLASGTDYKFVDCNGDGVIDPNDTTAVIQNFGFTHNNRTGGIPVYDASLPDLTITMGQSNLASNSPGTMTVSLGNSTIPASNVYGIAFTLNFDANQIDASSVRMNENGTWMGTPGNDMMGVVMNNGTGTGSVQVAITRLDHQDVSGFGDIANVGFVTTGALVGTGNTQNVIFSISDVTVISANETPQTVNTVNDSVNVSDPALMMGIDQPGNSSALVAYPNPFNESVAIMLPVIAREKSCELVITDAAGRIVRSEQVKGNSFVMQRNSMDAGIYICSIRCEGQLIANTKLVVK